MSTVYRIYAEKKPSFAAEARDLYSDLSVNLQLSSLRGVRILNRYDVEGVSEEVFQAAKTVIFSEPPVDDAYESLPEFSGARVFAVEYLPGQFDQRADSCAQCIQLLTQGGRPLVRSARVYALAGELSDEEFARVKDYLINPVEAREASLDTFETLRADYPVPDDIPTVTGFTAMDDAALQALLREMGFAMDLDDLRFCRDYFRDSERRDPTLTELRMIDTYWSDHCRHTTFLTHITDADIEPACIRDVWQSYNDARAEVYGERLSAKPVTLMDMATLGVKYLKKKGLLPKLDESEEINACSVRIQVDVDGKNEDWLLQFKNETHNHPTEIEPFGGAATCLGGAIRDPLSGRSYVYQAMRVTGCGDPRTPVRETMKGKLPQRKLTVTAAAGYSSYGNQIGLATGLVNEVYHPDYVAKRLEIGAVVGAVPAANVVREEPEPGDVVILLGGRTGRDGCGGATGSSKSHTLSSLSTCGAEVQKGNPPEERKLQRLFRKPEVTHLIRRCNDFGAGGVSVAVGELADGLAIDLDAVPKKYEGLTGTELAISESQERMAVVVRSSDADAFIAYAAAENLEATIVAVVTAEPRLKMIWRGKRIVSLSREFLNSNGASKQTRIRIPEPDTSELFTPFAGVTGTVDKRLRAVLSDLNVCSQKGLVERFDSTIGAASVVLPHGGKTQLTPTQFMAAKLPVLTGETDTASVMAYGFSPYLSKKSPFHGAQYAVIESLARLVASGTPFEDAYLTLQEFFPRTQDDPARWGLPAAALLGAFRAQTALGIAAIGGKDSMSGTFEHIDVPPTLVSFAVAPTKASLVLSPEWKTVGSFILYIEPSYTAEALPDYDSVKQVFDRVTELCADGSVRSVWAVGLGGVAEGLAKCSFGNELGFTLDGDFDVGRLFEYRPGAFLVEAKEPLIGFTTVGRTTADKELVFGEEHIAISELAECWAAPLEGVFHTKIAAAETAAVPVIRCYRESEAAPKMSVARPRVLIPVFPGTNCEYDSARAFERAGAVCETFVIRNLSSAAIEQSAEAFEKAVRQSQIIMLPGGFSGGDEPEGSGKFIATFLRNPRIREAVTDLMENRDGLMLGICNGFQALVKLGLVPYGEIRDIDGGCPTLTFNDIHRHQAMMVRTRIASVSSPWLRHVAVDDIHTIAISHGEGKFVADEKTLAALTAGGQIATQYVDADGAPTMVLPWNPNGSVRAIEGILSPDGRILGKMGHSERRGENVVKNVPGEKDQYLFLSGVEYFG